VEILISTLRNLLSGGGTDREENRNAEKQSNGCIRSDQGAPKH
jgi:hypothetical protein